MFPYLSWLEPHFVDRTTSTNFEHQIYSSVDQSQEGELEGEEEDEEHSDNQTSVASEVSNSHVSDVSAVTGRISFKKQKRYLLGFQT